MKTFEIKIDPTKIPNFDKYYKEYGKYIFATVS